MVNPLEMNALGLSAGQLAATIEARDGRRTAGEVVTDGHRLTVGLSSKFDALDRLREIEVATQQGQTIRLGELAELRHGVQDPPAAVALLNGERTVFVGARMAPGQRIDSWVEEAQQQLAAFADELPVGIAVEEVFEQASYTNQRLSDVAGSLLMGFVLVVAIPATALLTLDLAFVGESAPMMYYNVLTNEDKNPAFLHLIADTASLQITNERVPALQQALDRRFPQAQSSAQV